MKLFGKSKPSNAHAGCAAVLGCGPAGLFAAQALDRAGLHVSLFSKKRKSHMFGAQYLHAPIPGLPEERFSIEYRLEGTAAEYGNKVYGAGWEQRGFRVSPEELAGTHNAWDIRVAYDAAWTRWEDSVYDVRWLGPNWLVQIMDNPWDMVVTSIPLPVLCRKPEEHAFTSAKIWAAGDAPELGRFAPITTRMNTVVCSGIPDRGWYRSANVMGYNTVEWPQDRKPPLDVAQVNKPIGNTCDCYPDALRVGRYGRWTKGELSHQAYHRVTEAVCTLR